MTSTSTQQEAGAYTRAEIFSQPASWQGAVEAIQHAQQHMQALFAKHADQPVLFVGCGSPYYLNLSAAAAYRQLTGRWGIATPASEILLNLDCLLPGQPTPLVIAVSRSGETSELLAACKRLKEERGSALLAITVSENTSLQKLADTCVVIPNASEQSMAQTRSFSAMLIATLGAVAIAAGQAALLEELRTLPAQAAAYIERIRQPIADVMQRGPIFERIFFLGAGLRHGLAHEGSLKMKEMSLSNSEPFHFMEFRHGPQSMIDERTLVVGLVSPSPSAAAAETKVLREMVGFGGTVVALQPQPVVSDKPSERYLILPGAALPELAGLSAIAQLPFYMPAQHLLAYHQAMRKGLNCDSPRNLHAWIQLSELQTS
jgi:glucosamine--fructose-6-phosphate aminotransferase (isomerizing)